MPSARDVINRRMNRDRCQKRAILGAICLVFGGCFAWAVCAPPDEYHGRCYGVWTTQWTETKGSIKESLPSLYAKLNSSYPTLLRDVENHQCPFGTLLPGQITLPPWESSVVARMTWLKGLAVVWSYAPWFLVLEVLRRLLTEIWKGEFYTPEEDEPDPERSCCCCCWKCCNCCNGEPGESHRTKALIEFKTEVFAAAETWTPGEALLPPPAAPPLQKRRYISTKQLYVLVWLGLAIILQELVLKRALKRPRPGTDMLVRDYGGKYVGSCVPTCGMPSSHSMLATGWFTILFLERVSRVETMRSRISRTEYLNSLGQFLNNLSTSLEAWSSASHQPIDKYRFATHLVVWGLLLIPVPFARAELYDHSMEQAAYGSVLGVLVAFLWYRFSRKLQRICRKEEGRAWLLIGMFRFYFKHDMYLNIVTASDAFDGEWLLGDKKVQVEDFATQTFKRITDEDLESTPITELTVKKAVPTTLVCAAEARDKMICVASRRDWQHGDELHIDPDPAGMHDEVKWIQEIQYHSDVGFYEVTLTSALDKSHASGTKVYKAKKEQLPSFELREAVMIYCGSRNQWLKAVVVEHLPHGSLNVDCGVFQKVIPRSKCTADTIQKARFERKEAVEVYSNSQQNWVSAPVQEMFTDGGFEVHYGGEKIPIHRKLCNSSSIGKAMELRPGARVRLQNVKVRAALNGKKGTVMGIVHESQYWNVRLDNGQEIQEKPECLIVEVSHSKFNVKLPDHCSDKGMRDVELSAVWRTGQCDFNMRRDTSDDEMHGQSTRGTQTMSMGQTRPLSYSMQPVPEAGPVQGEMR